MPVVTVQCLPPDNPTAIDHALDAVVVAVAEAVGGQPSGTWAHWTPMAAVVQGSTHRGFRGHCPIVTIRGQVRDESVVAPALEAAAVAVSGSLGLPLEDVWVQWLEVTAGRAFAGGRLI